MCPDFRFEKAPQFMFGRNELDAAPLLRIYHNIYRSKQLDIEGFIKAYHAETYIQSSPGNWNYSV